MRFAFKELPGPGGADYLRPVVPVYVEGLDRVAQSCLLDTGSLHNRFGRWVADAAGIDLRKASRGHIAVAGLLDVETRTFPVQLRIQDVTWEAPVAFCDPWPFGFQLLGQEGFFRWFKVLVRAATESVDLTVEDR